MGGGELKAKWDDDWERKCRIKELEREGEGNKKRSSQELKQQRVTDPLWEAWREAGIQYTLWWEIVEANSSADRKTVAHDSLGSFKCRQHSLSLRLSIPLACTLSHSYCKSFYWRQSTLMHVLSLCTWICMACITQQAAVVIVQQHAFWILHGISQLPKEKQGKMTKTRA